MQKRVLGKTGLAVSEIGLGTWQLGGDFGAVGDDTAAAILSEADRLGVNFWDTADVYGGGVSESRIGKALKQHPSAIVATKVGRGSGLYPDGYTKEKVRASIEGSLKRLGVDTLDLVQTHTVPMPVMEDGAIFGWLDDFRQEGLLKHYGASVESVYEGFTCMQHSGLSTLQIIFSLFRQDYADQLLPIAAMANVGIIVRLPLASGLLSGKFRRDHRFAAGDHRTYNADGEAFNVGETFAGLPFEKGVEFAEEMQRMNTTGWPLAHLALRWLLDNPVTTVIAGVTRPQQLADNVAAAERPPVPGELAAKLAEYYRTSVKPAVRGEI